MTTQKKINKKKNLENVTIYEVVEVVFAQYNLVDNQCQQKSEVYNFTSNNYHAYLLYVKPSN